MVSSEYDSLRKTGTKDMHNIELLKACKYNKNLLGEFLQENRDFIFSIIIKYKGNILELQQRFNIEEDELLQLAYIGVISALKSFDFDRGISFTTFVVRPILWEINEFLYGSSHLIRLNRNTVDIIKKIKNIENNLGYTPNEYELESLLNIPKKKILSAINITKEIKSIQATDEAIHIYEECNSEEKIVNKIYFNQLLEKSPLTEFELNIIKLIKHEGLNNTQIAKRLWVYPMTINRAIKGIKEKLENNSSNNVKSSKYHNEISILVEEMKKNLEIVTIEYSKHLLSISGYNLSNYSSRIIYYIRHRAIEIIKK